MGSADVGRCGGGLRRAILRFGLAGALALAAHGCGGEPAEAPGVGAEQAGAPVVDAEQAKRLDALGYLDYAAAPDAQDADGLVLRDAARSWPGYNLITYPVLRRAEVFDAEGRVLRVWQDETGTSKRWERARLLPGGELLVVRRPSGILRLDAGGRVLWESDVRAHHDAVPLPDGRIATLTSRRRELPGIGPVWDNGVALLAPDGAVQEERSLVDMLATRPDLLPLVTSGIGSAQDEPLDLLHANYLEWILREPAAGGDPRFRPGTLLVTLRHQDALALFDWASGSLLWAWGRGELLRPHDGQLLENGHVLVFDNRSGEEWSRIVELDPRSGRIVWQYRGAEPSDFYSKSRGAVQRLPNGNTLIAASNAGRAFEVTPEGELVWEYLTPRNEQGRRPTFRLERYEPAMLEPRP